MRFKVALVYNSARVNDWSEQIFRRYLYANPIVRGHIVGSVGRVEAKGDGLQVVIGVRFIFFRTYGMKVRRAGRQGIVGDVDADHVVRHGGRGWGVGGRPWCGVARRWRPLYTHPANARTEITYE